MNQERGQDNKLERELRKASNQLATCEKVSETLKTPGWLDVLQLILDRMIDDIIGAKHGRSYRYGQISRPDQVEKTEFWLGYKQALMDYNNRVWAYIERKENIEKRIARINTAIEKGEVQPLQNSPYKPAAEGEVMD